MFCHVIPALQLHADVISNIISVCLCVGVCLYIYTLYIYVYKHTLYVSKHVAHCSIGEDIPFTITPFLTFDRSDVIEREEKENSFIQKCTPELNRD